MRTLTYQLRDLKKVTIEIGFEGENNRTQVRIDCGEVFAEYPNAEAALKVQAPKGGIYPATVTRDGNMILWTVRDCDVANKGNGEFQLTFTDGETVVKTCPGKIHIDRSLKGSGTAPSGVQDWLDRAEDALEQVESAEIHQPMIGLDGYWYKWDQEEQQYVSTGEKARGEDGDPGQPGTDATPDLITVPYEDMTFPVAAGTKCYHDGKLYEANQAIQTSEQWTAAHWTETTVEEQLNTVKSALTPLTPSAAAGDVGKYMKVKTVDDGKVTEYEFGTPSGGGGGSDIDDTAGAGDTDKVWSADKLTTKFGVIENLQTAAQTGNLSPFKQGSASELTGVIDETVTNRCYIGKIQMKAGDSFTYNRSENKITTTAYLAIYNTDGTFVSGSSFLNGATITFEEDGMFAISCNLNSTVSATMEEAITAANASFNATLDKTIKIVKTINNQSNEIVKLNNDIFKMNGFKLTESDMKTGVYYKITNGVVSQQSETGAKYYPLVDVSAFRGLTMKVWMNSARSGSSRSFGFCDAQGNVGNNKGETACLQVADGGYYAVLVVDKDYMFFSCSSTPTKIKVEISDGITFSGNPLINNGKYFHMSFDDVNACLKDITTNVSTYDSIFDNDLFAWCKEMHDKYGTTFSLYCFYADANSEWTLADVTNAFADEFTANADWLKFSLHAYNQNANYEGNSRESYAASDYTDTITQLVRITGSVNCIDRVPRLHEYKGTLTALKAMRDCDLGCVGFVASADYNISTPRDSYYFDSDENAYIFDHVYMYDYENNLHFVKTSLLWISSCETALSMENTPAYFTRNKYVEIFIHENALTSGYKSSYEALMLKLSYSHKPYYLMDLVLTN